MRAFASLAVMALAAPAVGQDLRVVDRREIDGSVLLVPRAPRQPTGRKPFLAATHWDLTPASEFFRVRDGRIPARRVGPKGDPPAVTYRGGQVVGNSWTNAFGGSAEVWLEKGEIVRLVGLNGAFKTVRMDLEAVCRAPERGKRLRGRVDFGLSGQVGGKTLDEANTAVGAILEPMDLSRVLEVCDPETALPPPALFPGTSYPDVVRLMGEPRKSWPEADGHVLDYGPVQLLVRAGAVAEIRVPGID
jgi:hypothetical protein